MCVNKYICAIYTSTYVFDMYMCNIFLFQYLDHTNIVLSSAQSTSTP